MRNNLVSPRQKVSKLSSKQPTKRLRLSSPSDCTNLRGAVTRNHRPIVQCSPKWLGSCSSLYNSVLLVQNADPITIQVALDDDLPHVLLDHHLYPQADDQHSRERLLNFSSFYSHKAGAGYYTFKNFGYLGEEAFNKIQDHRHHEKERHSAHGWEEHKLVPPFLQ